MNTKSADTACPQTQMYFVALNAIITIAQPVFIVRWKLVM